MALVSTCLTYRVRSPLAAAMVCAAPGRSGWARIAGVRRAPRRTLPSWTQGPRLRCAESRSDGLAAGSATSPMGVVPKPANLVELGHQSTLGPSPSQVSRSIVVIKTEGPPNGTIPAIQGLGVTLPEGEAVLFKSVSWKRPGILGSVEERGSSNVCLGLSRQIAPTRHLPRPRSRHSCSFGTGLQSVT